MPEYPLKDRRQFGARFLGDDTGARRDPDAYDVPEDANPWMAKQFPETPPVPDQTERHGGFVAQRRDQDD